MGSGMTHSRWIAVLAVPAFAAAVAVSAQANMLPVATHVIHVQPWGGDDLSCEEPPLALTCSDLMTLTDATGALVFDLMIYPAILEHVPPSDLFLHGVELALTWPEAWELVDWVRCSGATGVVQATTDTSGATLRLSWSRPPGFVTELLPIARLQLSAPTPGNLDAEGWGTVSTNPGEEPFQIYLGGQARVVAGCGDCVGSCHGDPDCDPRVSVNRLTMHVPFQSTAVVDFGVKISGSHGCVAPLEVASTLDWIDFGIEELNWPDWKVRVRADAASVAAGSYETWIRCRTICTSCVALTVIVDADPPAAEETSWGGVKARYRTGR